jgi:uncharacterized protein YndB with AHSA1/START domain
MNMAEPTTVTAEPGKTTIHITRWFDAPKALVYKACTQPELVKQWWGPCASKVISCEMDVRPGGAWRNVLRMPDGSEHAFHGVYREIVPRERIEQTSVYEAFPDAEAIETCVLEEHEGRTKMSVTVRHKTVENRDGHLQSGMEKGMNESHQRLDDLVRSLETAA